MHIRTNDVVEILIGDDRGKRGSVIKVIPEKKMVVVQGVNLVYRHLKPSKSSPQGGRLSKEMPIHISKVALVDPSTGRPTRLGVRYLADGSKELYAKKSGATIRKLAPAKAAYAAKN